MIQNTHDWANFIFGNCDLNDKRREKRLVRMAGGLADNIGKSVVKSSSTPAEIEGNYRLIRNQHVNAASIAEGGFASTVSLAENYDEILALEDTTTLSYKRGQLPDKLGYITNSTTSRLTGFSAHSILLYSPQAQHTIGLIEQQRWVRDAEEFGKRKDKRRPYEEKESYKWEVASEAMSQRLGAKLQDCISVCDREADIIEYLSYKCQHNQRFVARAKANRPLEGGDRLFDCLSKQDVEEEYTVNIPQRGGRKARAARVAIQYARVEVLAPIRKQAAHPPLPLYAVTCQEIDSTTHSGLNWTLLTTEQINNASDARKIISYYEARWKVELFHKVWKSEGTNVEALKMHQFDSLEKVAVIQAFIACRLMQLKDMGDSEAGESAPCTLCLTEPQWQLLYKATHRRLPHKDEVPTVKWAYQSLGKLAGWYDSKRTGRVGWKTLNEGLMKLESMMQAMELLNMEM